MRLTVKRLRLWIVVVTILLLAVLGGFLLHGRYRFRHIAHDLPARLGVNIQQTATGFSYSQSSQGHTLFTLKASKEFQMKSGHVLLHNVDITLYGPPGSGRTDHIAGSDFDYDQSQGIAISHGAVQIQLEGLGAGGAKQGSGAAAAPNAIQVQTSGLTFVQKTEQASTTQPVHFELPRASGTSVGAEYNAKTGVLVLDSQVHITTNSKGKTAKIGATHATLERANMLALLTGATLDYQTEHGSADQATVNFRKDGTAEKIEAQGHVRMATSQGATTEAATGVFLLNTKSQLLRADLGGGVTFAEAKADERMQGRADTGTLWFAAIPGASGATELRHAEFRENVRFTQETAEKPGDARGPAFRDLNAQTVDVEFATTAVGQPITAKTAIAHGSPVLTMRQMPGMGPHPGLTQTTRISGDELVATLGAGNTLQELDGTGHTQIESQSSDGARETSRGDVLRATFGEQPSRHGTRVQQARAKPAGGSGAGRKRKKSEQGPTMQTVLETAVQDGNVVLTEIPASHPTASSAGSVGATKPGTPAEPLTAWAEHAEYHAADEVLTLTGHPRMRQGETTQMSAEQIAYHRDTQDAEARGDVKATYTQAAQGGAGRTAAVPAMGGNGPVHVIAERATMRHATGEAVFYGTKRERARMWQGSDSLLAPTIEIDRRSDVLRAWSDGARPEVLANFMSAMGAQHEESLVSVGSQRLDYSDRSRQADFRGEVTAQHGDEVINADDALVFLKPEEKATSAKSGEQAGRQNSEIERVVATGHVVFRQTGRRGEGAKLEYTADDGKYVLTGTPEAQPQMWDRVHGTTTGAALIFNSQNDSVEVSGGKSSAVTKTRAPR
jgi:lipopolysaccharide export system protein LptA